VAVVTKPSRFGIWTPAPCKKPSPGIPTGFGLSPSAPEREASPKEIGKTLVSGSYDNTIKIWNLGTGKLQKTLTGHTNGVFSVAISPNGKTLVSGSSDKTIKIWNLGTGKLQKTLTGHTDGVFSVAISPGTRSVSEGDWQDISQWQ
jgi:WD40 repeat protein